MPLTLHATLKDGDRLVASLRPIAVADVEELITTIRAAVRVAAWNEMIIEVFDDAIARIKSGRAHG